MRIYLAILEGDDPAKASPVLATEDPVLIRIVTEAITRRLRPGTDTDLPLKLHRPIVEGA